MLLLLVLFSISMYFNSTLEIPSAPTISSEGVSIGLSLGFDGELKKSPIDSFMPNHSGNDCILSVTAIVGIGLADADSLNTIIASSPREKAPDLWVDS